MTVVSSHILDSVTGASAAAIRARLFHCHGDAGKTLVFDVFADTDGRVCESVDSGTDGGDYELILHSADYFSRSMPDMDDPSIVQTVVVRFTMPAAATRCHIPVMLSPHSYSVWWSK